MGKIHLLHVRSCKPIVSGSTEPKLPTTDHIEYGELAINYGKGFETLSIRNNEDEIVPFNIRQAINIQNVALSGVSVNDVDAVVSDHKAEVTISGSDINVGNYVPVAYDQQFSGVSNVSGDQTISEAFNSVETTLDSVIDTILADELVVAKAVQKIGDSSGIVGGDGMISYQKHTTANYINTANSLDEADVILDGAIKNVSNQVNSKLENINVNGVQGTVVNKIASVTISGDNVGVGEYTPIEYPPILSGAPTVSSSDTINQAFNDVETAISALTDYVLNNSEEYIPSTSSTYIYSATSLQDATEILDEALADLSGKALENVIVNGVEGTVADNLASVTISGNNIEVGDYTPITYPEDLEDAESIEGTDSVSESFEKVEHTISALTQEVIDNEKVTAKAIVAICNAAGIKDEDNNITYNQNENANYIDVAVSLADADNILDAAIGNLSAQTTQFLKNINVNSVQGTVESQIASVIISGDNVPVGEYTPIEYPPILSGAPTVSSGDTINQAFNDVETAISALTEYVLNNSEEYIPSSSSTYIFSATSLQDATEILDGALADLSGKALENIVVNGVEGTVANNIASVTISGDNVGVGEYTPIVYPSILSGAPTVSSGDTINQAFNDVETTISALTDYVLNHVDEYVPSTSATYIYSATSYQDADNILDEALAELSGKSLENIVVNGLTGTVTDNVANVSVSGQNVVVGEYTATTYPAAFSSAATNVDRLNTISQALKNIESTLSSLATEVINNERVAQKGFEKTTKTAGLLDDDGAVVYIPDLTSVSGVAYITTATSLNQAISLLDNEIQILERRVSNLEAFLTPSNVSNASNILQRLDNIEQLISINNP